MAGIDDAIDDLYRGDLAGFIAARNALAKTAKQPDLKTLEKPSLPAWAVNQVYWHRRDVFDRVVAAGEAVREAHARALNGRSADIRAAEADQRAAVRAAVQAAREHMTAAGQTVTPATLEAVTRTLEALPSPEAQGRLVRPLSPAGLEALAGLTLSVPARPAPSRPVSIAEARAGRDAQRAREQAERAARDREAREERRAAATAALAAAQAALAAAEAAVEAAEDALSARQRERDQARLAVRQARRERDAI
jgi:hypothetical protein